MRTGNGREGGLGERREGKRNHFVSNMIQEDKNTIKGVNLIPL
jgi:hypothetical protein